jgi:DNA-binding Xre family transcriptional regulator
MNERFMLNSELVRTWMDAEGRKNSWLAKQLSVSGSLLNIMLCEGHVPKERTLKRLAAVLGCQESELLIPRVADKQPA